MDKFILVNRDSLSLALEYMITTRNLHHYAPVVIEYLAALAEYKTTRCYLFDLDGNYKFRLY